ncbi:MAG: ribosome maturation factor RimM [Porphyromonas sp.]|nr:ribosome maturation factor RimM [Porphyromonas sp.]
MRNLFPKAYKQIGTCVQTHGTQGELALQLLSESFLRIEPEFVFVKKDGCMIPYPFSQSRGNKGKYILSIGFVSSMAEAEKLVGLPFYIDQKEWDSYLAEIGEEDALIEDDLIGFTIIDSNLKSGIGRIVGVMMIAENPLFEVETLSETSEKGDTFYIPIVEEWITNIDETKKEIEMSLPEGLI